MNKKEESQSDVFGDTNLSSDFQRVCRQSIVSKIGILAVKQSWIFVQRVSLCSTHHQHIVDIYSGTASYNEACTQLSFQRRAIVVMPSGTRRRKRTLFSSDVRYELCFLRGMKRVICRCLQRCSHSDARKQTSYHAKIHIDACTAVIGTGRKAKISIREVLRICSIG